ncbi:uncharacterized protein LOC144610083 [Rhinoraja longicauda]
MHSRLQTVTLLALAFACMYFPTGSANFVPRCFCRDTLLKRFALRNIVDYQIIPMDEICPTTQIILTVNFGGVEMEVCLSPDYRQGQYLVRCWDRIHQNNERKKECLKRKK